MKYINCTKVCIFSLIANSIVAYSGFVIILLYSIIGIVVEKKNFIKLNSENRIILISLIYLSLLTLTSVSKLLHILGIIIYLICILIYFIIGKVEKTSMLLKYFAIGNIIVAIGGILQFYLSTKKIPSGWVDSRYFSSISMRAYGVMKNPNVLAGYLTLCIALFIQSIEDYRKNKLKFIGLILSSYTLVLTFSRGGWLSVILISLLLAIVKRDKRYILFLVLFLTGISVIDGISGIERINPANSLHDNSIRYRFEIYKTALLIIKDNLFTGLGFFGTSRVLHNYSKVITAPINQPHNIFLYFLLEIGVIGCTFIVIVLKKVMDDIRSIGFSNIIKDEEMLAYIMAFITIGVHGLVDAVALAPQFLFYIIYILSLFKKRLDMLKCGEGATTKLEAYFNG